MQFTPTAPGTRLATLHLSDASGKTYDTALQGYAYGGTTRVTLTSEPGDPAGQGQTYTLVPGAATFRITGGRTGVGIDARTSDGGGWSGWFAPAAGDILTPGFTYTAGDQPFDGTLPRLFVVGSVVPCHTTTGSFTVTSADFAPDGSARGIAVSFEQHCDGANAALRGTFSFRAGNTAAPPPWLVANPSTNSGRGDFITVFSDPGEALAHGVSSEFNGTNASIGMYGSTSDLTVGASNNDHGF